MKCILSGVLLLALLPAAIGLAEGNDYRGSSSGGHGVPGQFDTYVLSMTYRNEFCSTRSGDPECQDSNVSGMVLHGLWPDQANSNSYSYCRESQDQLTSNNWCDPRNDVKSQMAPGQLERLATVMPGVASCLYNHEWYEHGTCSGLSVSDYFQDAQTLAERFRNLPTFNQLLVSSAGTSVAVSALMDALTQDLGSGGGSSIQLICHPSHQGQTFAQVNLVLNPRSFLQFPASGSFSQSSTAGNCRNGSVTIVR